jgi:uncharacterized membrane protein YcaP (DUF421 family)
VGDISEVSYAILEQNGSLSVLCKGESEMSHPIIIDGEVNNPALKKLGYNVAWLTKRLNEFHYTKDELFLMTVDDKGKIFIVERDKNEGQNNSGGNPHRRNPGGGGKRNST